MSLGACKTASDPAPAPSASAASRPAPAARVVEFRQGPTRIGLKRHAVRTSRISAEVEFWSERERLGTRFRLREEDFDRRDEVLALVGGLPAKVRIVYERYRLKEDESDKALRESEKLTGRTYVADATGKALEVTDAQGKPVSDEESETVRSHYARLGKADSIVEEIGKRRWVVGQELPLQKSLFYALIGSDSGEYKGGVIKVAALRPSPDGEAAALEWSAEMQTAEGQGMKTDWHVRAETVVRIAPAAVLTNNVKAVLEVSGQTKREGQWVRMEGDGTLRDELKVTEAAPSD